MDSFGAFIKAEREKKGISLKEISNITKISHHVLEALESDHVEEFPYPAFAKGFLHTYAKQIGLNSNEIVSRYVDFVTHTHSIDKNRALFDDSKQIGKVSIGQNKILTKAERMQGKRILPVFLVVFLIMGVWFAWSIFLKQTSLSMHNTDRGSFLSQKIEKLHAGLPEIRKEILDLSETEEAMVCASEIEKKQEGFSGIEKPAIASFGIENKPMSIPRIEESLIGAPAVKELEDRCPVKEKYYIYPKKELIISAIEQTWIDVEIDDTPQYDFMLYPGDIIQLEAQSKFSLLIGNAGGVTFTYEGKTFGPIGEHEEVVRLNLPQ